MRKSEVRESMITKLKNLSSDEKKEIESKLHQQLFETKLWKEAKTIGVTISNGFEWDTNPIIEKAWEQDKIAAVPKCCPKEKTLQFYDLKSYDQLETVYYSLLEPKPEETNEVEKQNIDLLLVPGVVFNKEGYRIGFGGGFYDRFLADYPNETISLISSLQLVDDLPIETHDLAVKHLMVEDGMIK